MPGRNNGRGDPGGRGGRGGRGRGVARPATTNGVIAEQSRASIVEEQWEYFEERIRHHHPDETYTDEQRELFQHLSQDGLMKQDARFFFQMFVHEWCALIMLNDDADLVPWNALTVDAKIEAIMEQIPAVVRALEARQLSLVTVAETDAPRFLFAWLELHSHSFNINLLVDMGMSLGFRYHPLQTSWHIAGKSYLLGRMCQSLFLQMHPLAEQELPTFPDPTQQDQTAVLHAEDNEEEAGDQPVIPGVVHDKFVANSCIAGRLKLCVFHTWHTQYQTTHVWSPREMGDDWLHLALQEYTRRTGCSFLPEVFPGIKKTLDNTWMGQFTSYSSQLADPAPPKGEWTDGFADRNARTDWIYFYSLCIAEQRGQMPRNNRRIDQPIGASGAAQYRNKRQKIAQTTTNVPVQAHPASGPGPTAASAVNGFATLQRRLREESEKDRAELYRIAQQQQETSQNMLSAMQQMTRVMTAFMAGQSPPPIPNPTGSSRSTSSNSNVQRGYLRLSNSDDEDNTYRYD